MSTLASSLGFIDSSVVNVTLAKLQSELGIGFEATQWVANAHLLTLASLILFGGLVGDTFGQWRTFILGLSDSPPRRLPAGLRGTAGSLVVFRGVQGVGRSSFQRASLVGTAFSDEDHGQAIGTLPLAGALTTALGSHLRFFASQG
jgi:MFS family permease